MTVWDTSTSAGPAAAAIRAPVFTAIPLTFPPVANDQVGTVTVPVLLLVGLNMIEFGGDCPALDRITV